ALFCLVIFVPGIATLPATDRDESLFAQTTKQMVESGDFVRTRFQERDSLTNPVGIYWVQSAAVLLVGPTLRSAIWPYRFPSLLAALICVAMTWRIGRTLFDDSVGVLGAGILAACPIVVVEAHIATTDAVLLACTTAAMASLASIYTSAIEEIAPARRHVAGFWAAMGVGILVKGPALPAVALLTIATLALADWPKPHSPVPHAVEWLKSLRPQWGILITIAIVAPWVIAITLASKGAFLYTFWHEVGPKLYRVDRAHGGPPGYYLVSSLVTFWPGSLAAFVAVGIAFHSDKNFGERFCLAWLVPAWIVAELIPTKLPHYVLPMFPSLALLTANAALSPEVDWKRLMHSWLGRTCQVAWAVVTILIAAALLAGPILLGESASPLSALPGLAVLAILVAAIAWIQRGRIVPAMWVSVAGTVAIY